MERFQQGKKCFIPWIRSSGSQPDFVPRVVIHSVERPAEFFRVIPCAPHRCAESLQTSPQRSRHRLCFEKRLEEASSCTRRGPQGFAAGRSPCWRRTGLQSRPSRHVPSMMSSKQLLLALFSGLLALGRAQTPPAELTLGILMPWASSRRQRPLSG
eukprot:scaffold3929_cov291-Pinguiococcus_pyrenoidosus.AAC.14